MKLELEGKKKLEAMKKRLAAGLPLAGLLAASTVAGAAEASREWVTRGTPLPVPREEQMVGETMANRLPEKPVAEESCDAPGKPGFSEKAEETDFSAGE